MSELFDIIAEFGFTSHAYADDNCTSACQLLHIWMQSNDASAALNEFVTTRNRLQLNEDKTQIIWLGTRQQLNN